MLYSVHKEGYQNNVSAHLEKKSLNMYEGYQCLNWGSTLKIDFGNIIYIYVKSISLSTCSGLIFQIFLMGIDSHLMTCFMSKPLFSSKKKINSFPAKWKKIARSKLAAEAEVFFFSDRDSVSWDIRLLNNNPVQYKMNNRNGRAPWH